jgi:hypothetical protein
MHHFRQNPMPEVRIEPPSSTPCFLCGSQGLDRALGVPPPICVGGAQSVAHLNDSYIPIKNK